MGPATAETISELLETHLEDDLRGVVQYDRGDIEVIRMRETIGDGGQRSPSRHAVLGQITDVAFEADDTPFGTHRLSTHCFEDIVALHVPTGADRGVVATFEAHALEAVPLDDCLAATQG